MAKINNTITIASLILLVLAGLYFITSTSHRALGSVTDGNNYYSTSTADTLNSTLAQTSFRGTTVLLKSGGGALAQVTVASTTIGKIAFYNGTTTNATLRNNAVFPTSTIAVIGASPTAGTYTYDAVFGVGLIVETTADFNGSYTITYR
jgi:hypothetical protein